MKKQTVINDPEGSPVSAPAPTPEEIVAHMEANPVKRAQPDQFGEIFEKYKRNFVHDNSVLTIHNLLWQIIINGVGQDLKVAFYNVYHEGKHVLARVFQDKSGFFNTQIEFKPGITDNEAFKIVQGMNKDVLGLEEKEANEIVDSSFKAQHNG